MRVTSMVAGLAIVLAACGGEKKAEEQTTTTAAPEQPAAAAPAAAPAAAGGGNPRREHGARGQHLQVRSVRADHQGGRRRDASTTRAAVRTTCRSGPTAFRPARQTSSRRACPTRWRPLEGPLLTEPDGDLQGQLQPAPDGRLQVLLPAAPRAGHARQDHGSVVAKRTEHAKGTPPRSPLCHRRHHRRGLRSRPQAARTASDHADPIGSERHESTDSKPGQRVHAIVHLAVDHAHGQQHGRHEQRQAEASRPHGRRHRRRHRGRDVRAGKRRAVGAALPRASRRPAARPGCHEPAAGRGNT